MDPRDLEFINELLENEANLKEVNRLYVLCHTLKFTPHPFTQRIREQSGEFEKKTRIMTSALDKVHSTTKSESTDCLNGPSLRRDFLTPSVVPALLETIRPIFHSCHGIAATLAGIIPQDEVWKWKELWTAPLRAAVFSVVMACFLTDGSLAPLGAVAEQLGSTSIFS